MRTTEPALSARLASFSPSRVVLEVETHSPLVSRTVMRLGHEAVVANSRRVRRIAENGSKSNGVDAELLARLGRVDPSLLKPIAPRWEPAQRDRILIQARDGFVRARTQLVNQVRGFAKALGTRLPSSSTEAFPKRVRATTALDLFPGLETLLAMIEQLTAAIRQMDEEVERLCRERYPETELLRQVPGVGAITALYYVLTLEDPSRFAKSRSVGAYVGLRPRQRDSGEQSPQLRITKAGDRLLRSLLVRCAHYILGPSGPDTDPRGTGLRMAEREIIESADGSLVVRSTRGSRAGSPRRPEDPKHRGLTRLAFSWRPCSGAGNRSHRLVFGILPRSAERLGAWCPGRWRPCPLGPGR